MSYETYTSRLYFNCSSIQIKTFLDKCRKWVEKLTELILCSNCVPVASVDAELPNASPPGCPVAVGLHSHLFRLRTRIRTRIWMRVRVRVRIRTRTMILVSRIRFGKSNQKYIYSANMILERWYKITACRGIPEFHVDFKFNHRCWKSRPWVCLCSTHIVMEASWKQENNKSANPKQEKNKSANSKTCCKATRLVGETLDQPKFFKVERCKDIFNSVNWTCKGKYAVHSSIKSVCNCLS